ncbi:hypothetical protein Patl1_15043 [Pistacia atlantica]|uniref:Uncharacterized protein n=1 Tax=Pistacia atlantica TaxID=434234 RepID=A0ACC1BAN1_9ROSI|nr:hypothetical protein Patl1_15043 [Pistacia atlantica]
MATSTYNFALILKNPLNDAEFVLLKQTPPPKFNDEEYDSYVDSDLWDLPFTKLNIVEGKNSELTVAVQGLESSSETINLSKFDVESALIQVLGKMGFGVRDGGEWRLWKCVEEAEFGPGFAGSYGIHYGHIGRWKSIFARFGFTCLRFQFIGYKTFEKGCKWMSSQSCLNWLVEVKPSTDRVGPLVVLSYVIYNAVAIVLYLFVEASEFALFHSLALFTEQLFLRILSQRAKVVTSYFQEYPPGVILVPMKSRTKSPFHTTNLILFAPESISDDQGDSRFIAHGEALIVDPGCRREYHDEV